MYNSRAITCHLYDRYVLSFLQGAINSTLKQLRRSLVRHGCWSNSYSAVCEKLARIGTAVLSRFNLYVSTYCLELHLTTTQAWFDKFGDIVNKLDRFNALSQAGYTYLLACLCLVMVSFVCLQLQHGFRSRADDIYS